MVSLTLKTGGAFKILKENIYRFSASASGSGSTVFYFTPFSSEEKQIEVDEAVGDINTDAGTFFIEATSTQGVQYLNPFFIVIVEQNGSGSNIVFGKDQNKPIQLTVTESVATISAAIDAATSSGAAPQSGHLISIDNTNPSQPIINFDSDYYSEDANKAQIQRVNTGVTNRLRVEQSSLNMLSSHADSNVNVVSSYNQYGSIEAADSVNNYSAIIKASVDGTNSIKSRNLVNLTAAEITTSENGIITASCTDGNTPGEQTNQTIAKDSFLIISETGISSSGVSSDIAAGQTKLRHETPTTQLRLELDVPTESINIFADGTTPNVNVQSNSGGNLGFYGAAAVPQPDGSGGAAVFAANTSGIVDDTATFGGYTIGQVVKALKDLGLLA